VTCNIAAARMMLRGSARLRARALKRRTKKQDLRRLIDDDALRRTTKRGEHGKRAGTPSCAAPAAPITTPRRAAIRKAGAAW
jgi:hypothetical protein